MPCLQRAVLLRAAAAVLALCAAVGADTAVGHALARRGAERAERDAYVCAEAARVDAAVRATRSEHEGRQDLYDPGRPPGCVPNGR
ncbi:hypothetical protein ACGFZP_02610 [Kitasatospora sp. NPDC048239]|uniref:hypothetical protein n=1 Tax=Kitasatospora sp. NPDC048239 TaxID=3364046 RepID=UPI0037247979